MKCDPIAQFMKSKFIHIYSFLLLDANTKKSSLTFVFTRETIIMAMRGGEEEEMYLPILLEYINYLSA